MGRGRRVSSSVCLIVYVFLFFSMMESENKSLGGSKLSKIPQVETVLPASLPNRVCIAAGKVWTQGPAFLIVQMGDLTRTFYSSSLPTAFPLDRFYCWHVVRIQPGYVAGDERLRAVLAPTA